MKKLFFAMMIALLPGLASAAGGAAVKLDDMTPDLTNQPSLQRGMQNLCQQLLGLSLAAIPALRPSR